jgi:beta-1,4-mannosyl-glycoprotein beta-1,4-N-acetylglucosaminyltransferase
VLIDVFPFSDEVDLAELRINYLSEIIDLFIVSEYDVGFSGKEKEFMFPRVLKKLPTSIRSKVLYAQQSQKEVFSSPFSNDRFQKDSISPIIMDIAKSDDLMIFGDLDEFPDKSELRRIISTFPIPAFAHFAQSNFMGFLNVLETSNLILSYAGEFDGIRKRKWLGSILTRVGELNKLSITELRNPERKFESMRIPNGGWHFSFCGGERLTFAERFSEKLRLSPHQEFNTKDILDRASDFLLKGSDPLGRIFKRSIGPVTTTQRPKFKILRGLEHLPGELSQFCRYEHLIAHS